MRKLLIAFLFGLAATPATADVSLVMVEEDGCIYCRQWTAEIGPIYPKTPEAACAPLEQIDINSDDLRAIDVRYPVTFTPTFILTDNNKEIARLEGYPGEDFFWGLLGVMLDEHANTARLRASDPCGIGFLDNAS